VIIPVSVKRPLIGFIVLFVVVYSDRGFASENGKNIQAVPAVPAVNRSGNSPVSAVRSTAPVRSAGDDPLMIPDGFVRRVLQKGESLSGICQADSSCEIILMKVNRIDKRHMRAGKPILVPVDTRKAMLYVPVPARLSDSRGEREIRIFLSRQYFGAYEKGWLLFWGPVSSGKRGRNTPPGKFFVNYKHRFKRSLKYDDAPMPFSINFNNGYFIHQQSMPGYPASHGCVRLLEVDAQRLFSWARLRDPVTLVIEQ